MLVSEELSIEGINKSLKQYFKDSVIFLEYFQNIKNKSFEYLDIELQRILKYTDGYIGEEVSKIKRLKSLIESYKNKLMEIYISLKRDLEYGNGKISKTIQRYSQMLYYLNLIKYNYTTNLYDNFVTDCEDNCIEGSLQKIFNTNCYVFGTENDIDKKFTGKQGNNNFGLQNDCGIACVTQIIILSGKNVTENDVVRVAISEGLCNLMGSIMQMNGATSSIHRATLLAKFNIKSRVEKAKIQQIANYIEHGHGVIVSVDAGILWDRVEDIGIGHAIVLYGTIHRASDGKLIGFVACDTGSGNMKEFIPYSLFEKIFYYERGINVTEEAIR